MGREKDVGDRVPGRAVVGLDCTCDPPWIAERAERVEPDRADHVLVDLERIAHERRPERHRLAHGARRERDRRRLADVSEPDGQRLERDAELARPVELGIAELAVLPRTRLEPLARMDHEELAAVVAVDLDLVLVDEARLREEGAHDVEVRERKVVDVELGPSLHERHVAIEEPEHFGEERLPLVGANRRRRAGGRSAERDSGPARQRQSAWQCEGHGQPPLRRAVPSCSSGWIRRTRTTNAWMA